MDESEDESADSEVEVIYDGAENEIYNVENFEDNVSVEFSSEESVAYTYSENEEASDGCDHSLEESDNEFDDLMDEKTLKDFNEKKTDILETLNMWKKEKRKFDESLALPHYNGDHCVIDRLSDDCLIHIFSYLPLKDRICIERVCKRWQIKGLESWRRFCKLSISNSNETCNEKWWYSANAKQLEHVLYRCGVYLDHIDVHLNFSRDDALFIIDQMCPNLRSITLCDVENFEPFAYYSLISGFRKLTDIEINSYNSSGNNFLQIFDSRRKLRAIRLDLRSFKIRTLWPYSESIQELYLSVTKISYTDLVKALREFKNLKKLFLRFIWIDNILRELVYLNNLKDLRLPQCNIHKTKIQEAKCISKLENLEWLDLTNTSEWFTDVTMLVNLRALRLQHNSYVTDLYILDLTEHCRHLTYLNISDCKKVSDVGIDAIAELPNLQRLNMENLRNISGKGLEKMGNLRHLDAKGCKKLEMKYIAWIIEVASQLKFLDVSECRDIKPDLFEVAAKTIRVRKIGVVLKICVSLDLFLQYEPTEEDSKLPLVVTSESMDYFYEYDKSG
ncbi:F-box/LRR-repeat protein 7-like isoform X2 [Belonocnema kinseyi]|uniref:F-box/LRR-repeat protein 7-like isoform X2 n=1 Tax=Belonocnema kinseyi TaxID=2817044 RepID=UPI00143CF19F|nr:F-box/LRR-repeat protein 7-like isoform X2 [Belonocnema kinseyi]